MEKSTFLGNFMAQSPQAIAAWERVLSDLEFARIIELGTGRGGFSLYLLLFCLERGAKFHTFNDVDMLDSGYVGTMLAGLRKRFIALDVLKEPERIINAIKRGGRTVLFCDNGNKPREAAMFGPHLKPGDILAVHDWNTEIRQVDIFTIGNFQPFRLDAGDESTRFFVKI